MAYSPRRPRTPLRISGMDQSQVRNVVIGIFILLAMTPFFLGAASVFLGPDLSGLICIFPIIFVVVFIIAVVGMIQSAAKRQRMLEEAERRAQGAPPYGAPEAPSYDHTHDASSPTPEGGSWGQDWRDSYQYGWQQSPLEEESASGTSVLGKCPKCGNIIYKGDRQCMRCGWKVKERRLRPF